MKRLFLIFIAVLFCIGMSVPAMAAEPQEYVFEIMPPISTLDDYEFLPEEGYSGYYEGFVPEGTYNFMFSWNGIEHLAESPVYVEYSYNADYESETSIFYVSCVINGNILNFEVHLVNGYDIFGFSAVVIFPSDNYSTIAIPDSVKFVSVEEDELSYSDIIHADLFGSFLICGTLIGLALFRGNRHA